jgi:hypothetical protein
VALAAIFPDQYSELSRNQTARHAASSWTQSGHLAGRNNKTRQLIEPTPVSVTMALFLGDVGVQVGGGGFAALAHQVIIYALAFDQRVHPGALNGRDVHKHVLAWRDGSF